MGERQRSVLLDGDLGHLDPVRSQLDLLLENSVIDGDRRLVPARHGSAGWFDHNAALTLYQASYAVTVWEVSQRDDDLDRVRQLIGAHIATEPVSHTGKSVVGNRVPYFRYLVGENAEYPEQVLAVGDQIVTDRLRDIENETEDLASLTVDDWHKRSPLVCEALVQTQLGSSGNQYHGGLLHAPVRHFDADRRRPGPPDDVAVLVDRITADSVRYRAVNMGTEPRRMVTQAGSFGEHRFDAYTVTHGGTASPDDPGQHTDGPSRHVELALPPETETVVEARLLRHRGTPSYETPWHSADAYALPIRSRVL